MTTQSVRLPNGQLVEGVPEGWTQSMVYDKLRKNAVISETQYNEWYKGDKPKDFGNFSSGPPPGAALPGGGPMDPAEPGSEPNIPITEALQQGYVDPIKRNADVPAGIAGAMAGGRVGGFPGAVVGGAVGTFGGELLSDWLVGDQLDFDGATRSALISGGLDTATLGTAKTFKLLANKLGFGQKEVAELWKKYTGNQALPVGSEDSLRQTQKFLTDEGGSLTAYQTGKTNAAQNISEGVAEIGILSGGRYTTMNQKNAAIIGNNLQQMIDDAASQVTGTNIGETIHGVIQAGKDAAQKMYNEGIDEIVVKKGNIPMNPQWISGVMRKFIKDNKTSFGSKLDPTTLALANEWMSVFKKMPTMPLKDVMAFQKKLNAQINQMAEFGLTQNTAAAAELGALSSRVREVTEGMLKDTDEAAYEVFKATNKAYGEAMDGLVPKLNANVITRADKGGYEAIARVLEGKNPDQIKAFMNSLETAYNQAGIAGLGDSVPLSLEKARSAIRGGWLKNIFGEQVTEGFDPRRFQRLADYYEKPANARAAQEILGEDWGRFKMLINAMSEATKKQSGFVGSLVLRGKESQAIQGMAAGGATMVGNMPAVAAILGGPVMLSKIVSNPNAVSKLLSGNSKAAAEISAGNLAAANRIMIETFEGIMDGMSEEDQAEIRNEIR